MRDSYTEGLGSRTTRLPAVFSQTQRGASRQLNVLTAKSFETPRGDSGLSDQASDGVATFYNT